MPEGFVCRQREGTFQVNFPPEMAGELAKVLREGEAMEAEVSPFRDAEPEAHPVYELHKLLAAEGPIVIGGAGEDDVAVQGKIVRLNHAKRGEVNGVILDTGDFVHLRPHGARELELEIGQTLTARGEVRPGWAGCRVIEAWEANGIKIEKPKKPPHPPHHDDHEHHHPPHEKPHHRKHAGHH